MGTDPCPSDLSDKEWAILQPLIFPGQQAGHPQVFELRRIVDAVFCFLRTGCQWRALPHDFPPWTAVFHHGAEWRRRGTWKEINTSLREPHRVARGREAQPTAAIVTRRRVPDIDSQSARTTKAGGPRGRDGGRKVSGRKRPILVDTEGTLLKACVHPAAIHDPSGGSEAALLREGRRGAELGFHVLKRRWVVERTPAWFGRNRRMSRDYERLIATAEMLLYACMAQVTLRRIAQQT